MTLGRWTLAGCVAMAAGPASAQDVEKINAWTSLSGLRGAPFADEIERDIAGCLESSDVADLSALCTVPVLLEGQPFRGGLVLRGGRRAAVEAHRLTGFSLIDAGADRCARLSAVAQTWRAAHKSSAYGETITLDGYELSWTTGATAYTFSRSAATAAGLGMHQRYRPTTRIGDETCALLVVHLGAHELVRQ